MIKKIISGGQTGVEQAALDASIQWKIPHGGWIQRGRKTEAGRLPGKYRLDETDSESNAEKIERNVADSDGTLIISHGLPSGGSAYAGEKAAELNKPLLHVDLNKVHAFQASHAVKRWISDKNIEILNVTGTKISKDKYIYQATMHLLTTVFHMEIIEHGMPDPMNPSPQWPETIETTIEKLMEEMPLRDKSKIANMVKDELPSIFPMLGSYIRNRFLWAGNDKLIEDCMKHSGRDELDEDEASIIIVEKLWEHLKETYRLRIVR